MGSTIFCGWCTTQITCSQSLHCAHIRSSRGLAWSHLCLPWAFFLSLEPGDVSLALINLSSIFSYEPSGRFKVLHVSLVDRLLFDKSRSTSFSLDLTNTCADFFGRLLQYVWQRARCYVVIGGDNLGPRFIHSAVSLVASAFVVQRAILTHMHMHNRSKKFT